MPKWSVGGGQNFQTESSRVTRNITVAQGAHGATDLARTFLI
jgi:outer membrane receptor for ferric coprogen and ferric-rhodotorulic acid